MDPTLPPEVLTQLRDIHLPPEPGFWPPAPGWWLLAGLVLALAAGLGLWAFRALRRYWLYRRVSRELDAICARYRERGDAQDLTAAVSRLLRRAALREAPPTAVAGLSGRAWLAYLDRSGATSGFSRGPGRCLATVPYGAADVPVDPDGLSRLTRRWLRRNLGA